MSAPTWKKLPALETPSHSGCLNCGSMPIRLPLEAPIAVGFGDAHASRDNEEVYREPSAYDPHAVECEACNGTGRAYSVTMKGLSLPEINELPHCVICGGDGSTRPVDAPPLGEYWTLAEVEALAVLDPDHDWRVVLFGPLHGETYQRHGPDEWNLIEKNQGFA